MSFGVFVTEAESSARSCSQPWFSVFWLFPSEAVNKLLEIGISQTRQYLWSTFLQSIQLECYMVRKKIPPEKSGSAGSGRTVFPAHTPCPAHINHFPMCLFTWPVTTLGWQSTKQLLTTILQNEGMGWIQIMTKKSRKFPQKHDTGHCWSTPPAESKVILMHIGKSEADPSTSHTRVS